MIIPPGVVLSHFAAVLRASGQLAVKVPGPGLVQATARLAGSLTARQSQLSGTTVVARVSHRVRAAGGLELALRLTPAGERLLRSHSEIRVKISVRFTAVSGRVVTRTITASLRGSHR